MTFWHINFFVAAVNMILFYLGVVKAGHQMKLRYPELCFIRTHWSEKLFTIIKAIVVSICPVFNLFILYALVVRDEKIVEDSIQDARKRYEKQVEEDSKIKSFERDDKE